MQAAVEELVRLGALPSSANRDISIIKNIQDALSRIKKPISNDEARALVQIFGPDDCFGLAWTLLHLIETAPGWPLWDCLGSADNEWVIELKERAERGSLQK